VDDERCREERRRQSRVDDLEKEFGRQLSSRERPSVGARNGSKTRFMSPVHGGQVGVQD
jgi:hypothetical protein